jgi:hypothetical protein
MSALSLILKLIALCSALIAAFFLVIAIAILTIFNFEVFD